MCRQCDVHILSQAYRHVSSRVLGSSLITWSGLRLWFHHSFANTLSDMGHTDLVEHEINLVPGTKPYYCPGVRWYAPPELEAIRKNVEEEMAAGNIIEFNGPWCAPIVLVKKKDGSLRKCVVYNSLNARTERESWPLPNIKELLERLSGHQWYSSCDGFSG